MRYLEGTTESYLCKNCPWSYKDDCTWETNDKENKSMCYLIEDKTINITKDVKSDLFIVT